MRFSPTCAAGSKGGQHGVMHHRRHRPAHDVLRVMGWLRRIGQVAGESRIELSVVVRAGRGPRRREAEGSWGALRGQKGSARREAEVLQRAPSAPNARRAAQPDSGKRIRLLGHRRDERSLARRLASLLAAIVVPGLLLLSLGALTPLGHPISSCVVLLHYPKSWCSHTHARSHIQHRMRSGLQRQVLALYRTVLRAARER